MAQDTEKLEGPDFKSAGVPIADMKDQDMIAGHADGEPVLLVRRGDEFFAVGGQCTHYGAPLEKGLLVGCTVRCPWHHAAFDFTTGDAVRAPALNPLPCWTVEQRDGRVFVGDKKERDPLEPVHGVGQASTGQSGEAKGGDGKGAGAKYGDAKGAAGQTERKDGKAAQSADAGAPSTVVIIGAGAAGSAAAEMLRRCGYEGSITMVDSDEDAPYDRPNVSKDYLAGEAQEEWMPLRPEGFYSEHGIDLRRSAANAIDVKKREVRLADGSTLGYDALLLATGAEPRQLDVPGHESGNLFVLRTMADSQAIIARAEKAKRAIVIGASFIGLEVAASLRKRGIEVHVVAPDAKPLRKVLGDELGSMVQALHEKKGVVFHLEQKVERIDNNTVVLADGIKLEGDFIVAGVGVSPRVGLAEAAGLKLDKGIVVDEYLQTSAPGVWAAGDIARWPDPHTGDNIRVEHWVLAQRQGQTAARNILGMRERFDTVPFFWSMHYDTSIRYSGHAEKWDNIEIDGDPAAGKCSVAFKRGGKTLAVASVKQDLENLEAERRLEGDEEPALKTAAK